MSDQLDVLVGKESCPVCGTISDKGAVRCPECGTFHSGLHLEERPAPTPEERQKSRNVNPLDYSINPGSAIADEEFEGDESSVKDWTYLSQYYSMDCYFRQYWRDERLSFKGLKNNANNLVINQLSLNVEMLKKIWKPGKTQTSLEVNSGVFTDTYFHNGLDSYLHSITRPNKLLRLSENGDITYSIRFTISVRRLFRVSFPD